MLVTGTLLIAGEGVGGRPVLYAYDKSTGERIAEIELPAPQTGVPMTYMSKGKQHIVIAVAGPGHSPELISLRLP